jgi:phage terminase small subunit
VRLTEKQKRFADYYIETGNATEAAIKAGYSQRTARFIGAENLTKPNIKLYIEQRLKELEDERIADATEVLQYLTSVMRGEMTETRYIAVYDKDGSFVEEREGPPTVRDRNKAAELLAKRYGLLNENMNINAEMAVKIVDDIDDED